MPGDTIILGLVVGTIVLTLGLLIMYPDAMRQAFYEPLKRLRLLGGVLLLAVGSWVALNSGVAWQMGVALVGIAFVVAFVYYEEPHQDIR